MRTAVLPENLLLKTDTGWVWFAGCSLATSCSTTLAEFPICVFPSNLRNPGTVNSFIKHVLYYSYPEQKYSPHAPVLEFTDVRCIHI